MKPYRLIQTGLHLMGFVLELPVLLTLDTIVRIATVNFVIQSQLDEPVKFWEDISAHVMFIHTGNAQQNNFNMHCHFTECYL